MPKLPLEDVPVAQSRWKPGTPRNEAKRKVASEDDGVFGSGWSWSDIGHLALDIAGFVPIVGDALDGVNAVWYASQGRYLEAAFSAISIIPGVGSFIGQAAKLALKGSEKGMGMLVKGIGELGGIDKVLSRITEIARKLGMDPKDLAKMKKALKEWYDGLVKKIKGEEPPAKSDASGVDGVTVTKGGGDRVNSEKKFWTDSITFQGNKVFQRNDLIDPKLVDGRGRSNIERMQKGLAPIGPDGKPLNLHHMTQRQSGAIAEMTQSFHQQNSKIIHINPNSIPSGINRSEFNKWRYNYWKMRANDF